MYQNWSEIAKFEYYRMLELVCPKRRWVMMIFVFNYLTKGVSRADPIIYVRVNWNSCTTGTKRIAII